jgi:hypothetical protein
MRLNSELSSLSAPLVEGEDSSTFEGLVDDHIDRGSDCRFPDEEAEDAHPLGELGDADPVRRFHPAAGRLGHHRGAYT